MAGIEENKKKFQRQLSKKLWIKEITQGELIVTEGLQTNVLKTSRGDAARVNVIGTIVNSQNLPTATLVLDDGTGNITVRSFDRPLNFEIGDFIQIIGRPRVYQGEPYIALESAAKINPQWAIYRQKEIGEPLLLQKENKIEEKAKDIVPETEERETNAEKIIRLINELDTGSGAPIEEVALKSKVKDAEAIIEQLLLSGDIFELRPGKVKVL